MEAYKRVTFNRGCTNHKLLRLILEQIEGKMGDYHCRNYLEQTLDQFTDGAIYYDGSGGIAGLILLESKIDVPCKSKELKFEPNGLDILMMYYGGDTAILDGLLAYAGSWMNFGYMEIEPDNAAERELLKARGFFVTMDTKIDGVDFCRMKKLILALNNIIGAETDKKK